MPSDVQIEASPNYSLHQNGSTPTGELSSRSIYEQRYNALRDAGFDEMTANKYSSIYSSVNEVIDAILSQSFGEHFNVSDNSRIESDSKCHVESGNSKCCANTTTTASNGIVISDNSPLSNQSKDFVQNGKLCAIMQTGDSATSVGTLTTGQNGSRTIAELSSDAVTEVSGSVTGQSSTPVDHSMNQYESECHNGTNNGHFISALEAPNGSNGECDNMSLLSHCIGGNHQTNKLLQYCADSRQAKQTGQYGDCGALGKCFPPISNLCSNGGELNNSLLVNVLKDGLFDEEDRLEDEGVVDQNVTSTSPSASSSSLSSGPSSLMLDISSSPSSFSSFCSSISTTPPNAANKFDSSCLESAACSDSLFGFPFSSKAAAYNSVIKGNSRPMNSSVFPPVDPDNAVASDLTRETLRQLSSQASNVNSTFNSTSSNIFGEIGDNCDQMQYGVFNTKPFVQYGQQQDNDCDEQIEHQNECNLFGNTLKTGHHPNGGNGGGDGNNFLYNEMSHKYSPSSEHQHHQQQQFPSQPNNLNYQTNCDQELTSFGSIYNGVDNGTLITSNGNNGTLCDNNGGNGGAVLYNKFLSQSNCDMSPTEGSNKSCLKSYTNGDCTFGDLLAYANGHLRSQSSSFFDFEPERSTDTILGFGLDNKSDLFGELSSSFRLKASNNYIGNNSFNDNGDSSYFSSPKANDMTNNSHQHFANYQRTFADIAASSLISSGSNNENGEYMTSIGGSCGGGGTADCKQISKTNAITCLNLSVNSTTNTSTNSNGSNGYYNLFGNNGVSNQSFYEQNGQSMCLSKKQNFKSPMSPIGNKFTNGQQQQMLNDHVNYNLTNRSVNSSGTGTIDNSNSGDSSTLNRPTNLMGYKGLWVCNVSPDVTLAYLKRRFRRFGHFTGIQTFERRATNGSNIVFVHYDNPYSPVEAINSLHNCNQQDLCSDPNEPLKLRFAPSMEQSRAGQLPTLEQARKLVERSGECFNWRLSSGCHRGVRCQLRHVPINKEIDSQPWVCSKKSL